MITTQKEFNQREYDGDGGQGNEAGRAAQNKWRNLAAFWLLALCGQFPYVVMLSAAHDVLSEQDSTYYTGSTNTTRNVVFVDTAENASSALRTRQCNKLSTGAVVLANILPSLLIKLTAPFYLDRIPYYIRTGLIAAFSSASFLIVSRSVSTAMSLFGVACASVSAALSHLSFLSMTSNFHKNTVSAFSSGHGAAGLLSALLYATVTSAQLTPRNALLVMLVTPLALLMTYFMILKRPNSLEKTEVGNSVSPSHNEHNPLRSSQTPSEEKDASCVQPLRLRRKVELILPLLKSVLPLSILYFGGYFINQGLLELLEFDLEWISLAEQYRWCIVTDQVAAFLAKSSANILPITRIWILSVLQCCNVLLLTLQAYYHFIPSFWVVLIIIFFVGLLGGSGFVNTFHRVRNESVEEEREYSLTFASMATAIGISAAGALALPIHDRICSLPKPH